jgi:hypothetical protein
VTIDLPTILQKYFQAQNAHDIEAMVACFAADATVRDESRDIIGADAIAPGRSRLAPNTASQSSHSKTASRRARQLLSPKYPAHFPEARRT